MGGLRGTVAPRPSQGKRTVPLNGGQAMKTRLMKKKCLHKQESKLN